MVMSSFELFHDGGLYHIQTSPLICSGKQWTAFYMKETSAMKELRSRTLLES